jgi:peptidyl-dipeptidase Dcp
LLRLQAFAKELTESKLENGIGYYSEKLKQKLFDFDDEKLVFPIRKVLNGAFTIAQKLYGFYRSI